MDERLNELRRCMGAGEHIRAERLAGELLENPEGLTDSETIEVARHGATAAMSMNRVYVAHRFADIERQWADGTGDPVQISVAVFHQGTVALHINDLSLALDHLTMFREIDTPTIPGLDRYRGPALYNLADCLQRRKQYADASVTFREARDVFASRQDHQNVIRCYLQAAWSELFAGNTEPAGAYLGQAVDVLVQYPDPELQNTCLVHRALYHQKTGDYAAAIDLCREVLTPGRREVTSLHIADASWIAGECALAQGHVPAAEAMAALALDEAAKANWPPALSRANNLRGRVIQAKQQGA